MEMYRAIALQRGKYFPSRTWRFYHFTEIFHLPLIHFGYGHCFIAFCSGIDVPHNRYPALVIFSKILDHTSTTVPSSFNRDSLTASTHWCVPYFSVKHFFSNGRALLIYMMFIVPFPMSASILMPLKSCKR